MHFGNSAGNFGGSAVRRPVGHDPEAAMSKLVALLLNYMQIVQNWSEKGVHTLRAAQSAMVVGMRTSIGRWSLLGLSLISMPCGLCHLPRSVWHAGRGPVVTPAQLATEKATAARAEGLWCVRANGIVTGWNVTRGDLSGGRTCPAGIP